MTVWITHSPEETEQKAALLGSELPEGALLCLKGELGAGKTTFIRGLTKGVLGGDYLGVSSPTFVYLHSYEGNGRILHHFDLYRLRSAQEFIDLGFEEFIGSRSIVCIEWSERIEELLTGWPLWVVQITHAGENCRCIELEQIHNIGI